MSRSDLPLWARIVAAGLLIVASWWLQRTDAVSTVVGMSVALVGVGVVAASILRGMGLPLSLWPHGPWRDAFWAPLVVAPAMLVAAMVLVGGPARDPTLVGIVDLGIYLLVASGVVAWGFGIALVTLRPFVWWLIIAVVVGLAPTLFTVSLGGVESTVNAEICWVSILDSPTGSGCLITYPRAAAFLAAVAIPASLVSTELAFRRLLLGAGGTAGAVVVLLAAAIASAWTLVVGGELVLASDTWWMAAVGAIGAGSLYVLSRSLLVSATYTGCLLAGLGGIPYAAMDPDVSLTGLTLTGSTTIAHAVVVVGLLALVTRRNGLFAGLR